MTYGPCSSRKGKCAGAADRLLNKPVSHNRILEPCGWESRAGQPDSILEGEAGGIFELEPVGGFCWMEKKRRTLPGQGNSVLRSWRCDRS